MTDVALVPATVAHLAALRSDPAAFGAMIDSPIPAGWPEFQSSRVPVIERKGIRESADK